MFRVTLLKCFYRFWNWRSNKLFDPENRHKIWSEVFTEASATLEKEEVHIKMSTSWHRANVSPLTAMPSLCPNCCCHPCATVSSAADWGSSPGLEFCRTARETLPWRGVPLSARDCENDLDVRGDSCHACGCDPATHAQGKKNTQIWSEVVHVETLNWQRTVALLI